MTPDSSSFLFVLLIFSLPLDRTRTEPAAAVSDNGHHHSLLIGPHPHRRKQQVQTDDDNPFRHRRQHDGMVFPPNSARSLYCYSCMSKRLESNWEFLWLMYRRPEQFSETCDPDHFRRGLVKLRNCTDFCIWINAETQVFGQKIPIYTRGCMSDVLNYRQDDARLRKLRKKDECVKMNLAELFNDGERKVHNNERVELCACHSNYCNGAQSGTSVATVRSTLPLVITVLLVLLVASGFWRCPPIDGHPLSSIFGQ